MNKLATDRKKSLKRLFFNRYLIAGTVLSIGVLSYFLLHHYFFKGFGDFESKTPSQGTISDYGTAISGIVGTAITVSGLAFLAYAYRDQQRQAEFSLFTKLYEDILTDINSIQYRKKYAKVISSPDDSELFEGVDALYNYEADDGDNQNSVLNHLNLILVSFEHIIDLLDHAVFQDSKFEKIMKDKVYLLFFSKIYWPCFRLHETYRDQLIRSNWGNAPILFFKFEKFTKQTYEYLVAQQLVFLAKPTYSLAIILSRNYDSWQTHWQTYPIPPAPVPTSRLANKVMAILNKRPILFLRQVYSCFNRP